MQITNIKESGTNNVLRWAISNGADIKNDIPLQSLVNDELFYLVTISDVNFLELFRLTQMYREKVRIIDEKKADVPIRQELVKLFNGDHAGEDGTKVPLCELVEYACQNFLNLAMQMHADDDIIRPETTRLFIPMLCRKFDVQIPVGFMDLVSSIPNPEEAAKLFNESYPNNLNEYIIEPEISNVRNVLYLGLMKGTSIIRYDEHYDKLLKMTKYSTLRNASDEHLYKLRLCGFYKYDNISRGEVRCSMFHPDKGVLGTNMKKLGHLNSPLKVDFVVQLPLQYLQMIENTFSRDELPIAYESSMSSIIDGGIRFNDFISCEIDPNTEDEEEKTKLVEYQNSIEAYRTRINEANQITLNTIPIMLNNEGDIDITSTFAMLPAIYTSKAVITIDMSKKDIYLNRHYDPTIATMFEEMLSIGSSILTDIQNPK